MRVLFVGHTYMVGVNRRKLRELASFDDVKLSLVVPQEWPHYLKRNVVDPEENSQYALYPTRTIFHGRESLYFYFPDITMHIHKIKPDIIHVEQGANALSYTQAILSKKIFAPRAKCLFFTWVNLPYTLRSHRALVEKFNFSNSDYAIAGNQDAKNILRQRGFDKPIKVLPQLGVDVELYRKQDVTDLRDELGLDAFTIGYVGRFAEEKGLLTLIEAASTISEDYHLLLVGRGGLKPRMVKLATERGVNDRMHFIDTVPHHKVPLYMNCMDVMVLPSLTTPTWKEQFGHVLIEAMACKTPVIGSNSAEIPNVIGNAGLIFKEGDADDLAEKLQMVIENEGLRNELSQKGRRRVLEKYTHRMIAEETYKVYQELLEEY